MPYRAKSSFPWYSNRSTKVPPAKSAQSWLIDLGLTNCGVPPDRSDTRLLLTAAAAVLFAGVLVAVVLLFATGQGGSPNKNQPFYAGLASDIRTSLRDGGPYYVPDPFGGHRSILFALENGNIVALSTMLPGTKDYRSVEGPDRPFVDCHGDQHRSADLDRHYDFIDPTGKEQGDVSSTRGRRCPHPAKPPPARPSPAAPGSNRFSPTSGESSRRLGLVAVADQSITTPSPNFSCDVVAHTDPEASAPRASRRGRRRDSSLNDGDTVAAPAASDRLCALLRVHELLGNLREKPARRVVVGGTEEHA
jgi:hypothetical protein